MKFIDKEWLAFAFRLTEKGNVSEADLYGRVGSKSRVKWSREAENQLRLAAYESEIRYFSTLRDDDSDEEESESLGVRIIRRGGTLRFRYPILTWRLRLPKKPILIVAVPYVGLAREILGRGGLRFESEVEFAAPNLEKVYTAVMDNEVLSIEEALKSDRALMLVRAGRVNFAADTNLRAAVLLGDNIFESALYKHLAPSLNPEGAVWLGTDVARMAFWGPTRRRIVVQLDRFGNFKIRVGSSGERLGLLAQLITFVQEQSALEWREKYPALRMQELS